MAGFCQYRSSRDWGRGRGMRVDRLLGGGFELLSHLTNGAKDGRPGGVSTRQVRTLAGQLETGDYAGCPEDWRRAKC